MNLSTAEGLRIFAVVSALVVMTLALIACIVLPSTGLFGEDDDIWSLWQITLPVVMGLLGAAATFAAGAPTAETPVRPMIAVLVVGPLSVAALGFLTLFAAYYVDHRVVIDGRGMSFETFRVIFTALIGLIAASMGFASSLLFKRAAE